jgi:hypothetical protein
MDLIQIGSTLGFPALMCIMLFRKMEKQEARYINNENKLRQVISDNTLAIIELKNQLQKGGKSNV